MLESTDAEESRQLYHPLQDSEEPGPDVDEHLSWGLRLLLLLPGDRDSTIHCNLLVSTLGKSSGTLRHCLMSGATMLLPTLFCSMGKLSSLLRTSDVHYSASVTRRQPDSYGLTRSASIKQTRKKKVLKSRVCGPSLPSLGGF